MKQTIEGPATVAKVWTDDVEPTALAQVRNLTAMPFIHHHIAVMPDAHWGNGTTVGSVIPTIGAIIPAAVGVDIGCGMIAVQTTLNANDLGKLGELRSAIERSIPVGGPGIRGSWSEPGRHGPPASASSAWRRLQPTYQRIIGKHPKAASRVTAEQLGTLGTGNHFIEICLDQQDSVWAMLHSGSRGLGNRIGAYFIERAKEETARRRITLPDRELAYLQEDSSTFGDYVEAVQFAQEFARENRDLMMERVLDALRAGGKRPFELKQSAINCHHNYVTREHHYGKDVWLTRKGAVRAGAGELGIIPGSMGARSFIVRGKGNPESFESCSHGAGRKMSRGEARRRFTPEDLAAQTCGIECRKDRDVVDEIPSAYKPIDEVMANQSDLVEVVAELRQIVCIKG